jgi:hypothetical protein
VPAQSIRGLTAKKSPKVYAVFSDFPGHVFRGIFLGGEMGGRDQQIHPHLLIVSFPLPLSSPFRGFAVRRDLPAAAAAFALGRADGFFVRRSIWLTSINFGEGHAARFHASWLNVFKSDFELTHTFPQPA